MKYYVHFKHSTQSQLKLLDYCLFQDKDITCIYIDLFDYSINHFQYVIYGHLHGPLWYLVIIFYVLLNDVMTNV